MINLLEIKAKNFKSWKELELTDLNTKGLCLISAENGAGKCIEKDSYLYHNSSLCAITSLSDSWNFDGFKPSNLNISTSNGINVETSDVYTTTVDSISRIKTDSGYSLGASSTHKILCIDKDGNFSFKKMEELNIGDYVCIDRKQNLFPIDYPNINFTYFYEKKLHKQLYFEIPKYLNEDLSRLLGYYIANGSYDKQHDRVTICTNNKVLVNDIECIANKLNISFRIYAKDNISLGGTAFARFFKYLLDDNCSTARTKTIPSIILKAPKTCQIEFLKALIDSDGYYSKNGATLEYYSASYELIKIVHLMLLNFGIISRLHFKDHAKVGDKVYIHNYNIISIHGKNIDLYFDKIGSLYYIKIDKNRNPNKDIIPYIKNIIDNEIFNIKKKLGVDKCGRYIKDNKRFVFFNTSIIKSVAIDITYEKLLSFYNFIIENNNIKVLFSDEFLILVNNILTSSFYFDKIIEKNTINETIQVYDVSIPEYHTFYANGFINHNSSVRNIIEYLLLDDTAEGIDVKDLIFNSDSECEIYGKFDKDGDLVEITKYRNHKKYGNSTILSINGDTSKTKTDRRETQKAIEEVLGITKDSVYVSTIFSTNSPSFVEAKEGDRKKIVYDAQDLGRYNTYLDKVKTKISNIESEISSIDNKLSNKRENIGNIEHKLLDIDINLISYKDIQKNKIKKLEDERDNLSKEEYISFINKIKILNEYKDFAEFKIFSESLYENINKLLSERNILKEVNFEDIKYELDLLNNMTFGEVEDLTEKYNYINELQKNINNIDYEIKDLNKKLKESDLGICPILKSECQTLLDKKNKAIELYQPQIDAAVKEKEIKIESLKEKEETYSILSKKNKEIENSKIDKDKKIVELTNKINIIKNNNSTLDQRKKLIDDKIQLLINNEIDKLKNEIKIIENNNKNIEIRKVQIEEEIEKILNEKNPYINIKKDLDKEYKEIKLDIENKEKELDKLKDELRYYEFWKVGFSKKGIPNLKIEGFLEALEIETNKILSEVESNTYVTIESGEDKILYKVHSNNGSMVTNFKSFSGGEKQRIKIADMFAFNTLLGKFNFIIADEALEGSLDSTGKSNVLNLLRNKLKEISNIFVISHSEQIKDSFNNVINIEKENGVSRIC
jgi:DNA repair exonuclease SbcCD ATPase subunit/intein/homing endonuclease